MKKNAFQIYNNFGRDLILWNKQDMLWEKNLIKK